MSINYGCVHDLSKMLLLECPIMIFSPFSYHTCSYIVHFQKCQGRIQDFFRRGGTRLLLYFNTNKPHSFFFLQNTSCIRKPQVISGRWGGCTPPAPSPQIRPWAYCKDGISESQYLCNEQPALQPAHAWSIPLVQSVCELVPQKLILIFSIIAQI